MGLFALLDTNILTQHTHVKNVNPNNEESKSKLTDEIIAGAAVCEATKVYDNTKKPETPALAKEKLAELVNAQVEKLMEKKKLDAFDKEKTKKLAKEHAEAALKKSGQF